MKCKKVYNVALYSKSIKTNISRINKKVNIMIISSLGRKEGNEIKMDTKEGIFHSTCTVLFLYKRNLGPQWLGLGILTVRAPGSILSWGNQGPASHVGSWVWPRKK